jgi:hypothetical protein
MVANTFRAPARSLKTQNILLGKYHVKMLKVEQKNTTIKSIEGLKTINLFGKYPNKYFYECLNSTRTCARRARFPARCRCPDDPQLSANCRGIEQAT